jgi:hypothetical protein
MLETLATRAVSPLLFHGPVHNAPSGYSIGYQNRQSATSEPRAGGFRERTAVRGSEVRSSSRCFRGLIQP